MVDNNVGIIDRSFGFHTALEAAQRASTAANDVGLMKLMGQSTSHIAMYAMLSIHEVDCRLIPRRMAGGLFEFLYCVHSRGRPHRMVILAEGAGQRLIPRPDPQQQQQQQHDKSGNPVFLNIGAYVAQGRAGGFGGRMFQAEEHVGELLTLKYIDPTFMVHAVAADNLD